MKPAPLTSALLARKGGASPAFPLIPSLRDDRAEQRAMGRSGLPAVSAEDRAMVAKLTLRLDRDRHLKLKLAAAHLRMSAQEILTKALDQFLDDVIPNCVEGGCQCLARLEQAQRDGTAELNRDRVIASDA